MNDSELARAFAILSPNEAVAGRLRAKLLERDSREALTLDEWLRAAAYVGAQPHAVLAKLRPSAAETLAAQAIFDDGSRASMAASARIAAWSAQLGPSAPGCSSTRDALAVAGGIDTALADREHFAGCVECRDAAFEMRSLLDTLRAAPVPSAATGLHFAEITPPVAPKNTVPDGVAPVLVTTEVNPAITAGAVADTQVGMPAALVLDGVADSAPVTAPATALDATNSHAIHAPPPVAPVPVRNGKTWQRAGLAAGVVLSGAALLVLRPMIAQRFAGVDQGATVLDIIDVTSPTGTTASATNHGAALNAAGTVGIGAHVVTGDRTQLRAKSPNDDRFVLEPASALSIPRDHELKLESGSIACDLHATPWKVGFREGQLSGADSRFQVIEGPGRTHVSVARGAVDVVLAGATTHVESGQEAVIENSHIDVVAAEAVGDSSGEGRGDGSGSSDIRGVGTLSARKAGEKDEAGRTVRMARHRVAVRVAGPVARTEIEEEFYNDSADVLEGIYRFVLPENATVEGLALDVDGAFVDGEFVEAKRAEGIWKGALWNATPKAAPQSDIVWVAGPWRDPAMLSWQRSKFELRIFPIPAKGSRRIKVSYTHIVPVTAGERRLETPLPMRGTQANGPQIDASIELRGIDAAAGVFHEREKPTEEKLGDGAKRFVLTSADGSARGNLVTTYTLPYAKSPASAWAFEGATPSDRYVAFAIRPKLPPATDLTVRDQVLVVDTSRGMVGKRAELARAIAHHVVTNMDRRDRVTVIACDIRCRPLAAGFIAPGPLGAADIEAFLAPQGTDGAFDLRGAFDAATALAARDAKRSLRITLLGAGQGVVGGLREDHLATDLTTRLKDVQVVSVPLGEDADTDLYESIARLGHGVSVRPSPSESVELTAERVLRATYGTRLGDISLELPDGITDIVPKTIASIPLGGESWVYGKLAREATSGPLKVHGNVAGVPFEGSYPLDVKSVTGGANGFVPRLYAAARIHDLGRTESTRDESVKLSQIFHVPSPFTSLLVLESPAMFAAFGIHRSEHDTGWNGEIGSSGTQADNDKDSAGLRGKAAQGEASPTDLDGDAWGGTTASASKAEDNSGVGGGYAAAPSEARRASASAGPAPAPAAAAVGRLGHAEGKAGVAETPMAGSVNPVTPKRVDASESWPSARRPGRYMRQVYVRHGELKSAAASLVTDAELSLREQAMLRDPDARKPLLQMVYALFADGDDARLERLLARWEERNPKDHLLQRARASLAHKKGQTALAIRILSGILVDSTLVGAERERALRVLADSLGTDLPSAACGMRMRLAEERPLDVNAITAALRCHGDKSADAWGPLSKTLLADVAAKLRAEPAAAKLGWGEITVTLRTDSGEADVAVLLPGGERIFPGTDDKRIASLRTSRDQSALAITAAPNGRYLFAVSPRASRSARGTLTVSAFGSVRSFPFDSSRESYVAELNARTDVEYREIEGGAWMLE